MIVRSNEVVPRDHTRTTIGETIFASRQKWQQVVRNRFRLRPTLHAPAPYGDARHLTRTAQPRVTPMSILTRSPKRKPSDFDMTTLALTDVEPTLVARVSSALSQSHHLAGWCGVDDSGASVVAFQLDHGGKTFAPPTRPRFRLRAVKEFVLGYGLRLVARDGKTTISHVWLGHERVGLRALLERRVATMLFFRGTTFVAAYGGIWAGTDEQLEDIKLTRRLMRGASLPLAAGLRVLDVLDKTGESELLTIEDRAAASWFQALEFWSVLQTALLATKRSEILDAALHYADLPDPVARAVAVLRSSANPMPALAQIAADEWRAHRLRRILPTRLGPPLDQVNHTLFLLGITGDDATRSGTLLPCVDYSAEPSFVPIDLPAIESRGGLVPYWTRILYSIRYLWARFLTGTEMPAWPSNVAAAFPEAALVDDVDAAHTMATALIREAVRDSHGTIPYGAKVELRVGPFTHANVYPFTHIVLFQCWTTAEEFLVLAVWLDACTVTNLQNSITFEDSEGLDRMNATLSVMLAAIVRDFSVTEHRERVFATRIEHARPARPPTSGSDATPTIVYLPRVRYARAPDVERGTRELRLVERRIHDVTPHLRRSVHASPEQLALATIYGMAVPDGFTFVRAHRRGTKEADVVYRSRSAMQAIFEPLDGADEPATSGWFWFEASVRNHLDAAGLSIERMTPMSQGVEILAAPDRGEGLCLIHAVDRDKVSTAQVDALARRRAEAPHEVQVRALLLTRGEVSSPARARAAEVGIEIAERIGTSALR